MADFGHHVNGMRCGISLSPSLRLSLSVRGIAVMDLKSPLERYHGQVVVNALPWGLREEGGGELEIAYDGHKYRLEYERCDRNRHSFQLREAGGEVREVVIPKGAMVKLLEDDNTGYCHEVEVVGMMHFSRSPQKVVRSFVLLNQPNEGLPPFVPHKITLRKESCPLARQLFDQWSSTNGGGVVINDPQALNNVERGCMARGRAELQDAAVLRCRLLSLVDQEVRLVNEADTCFPHIQPDVEVLISGISNRFIALSRESYMLCATINVRVKTAEGLWMTKRFSSLNCDGWRMDGHYADRFLINTLYEVLKGVEHLNNKAVTWEERLSLQVYCYDLEFCRAVKQMLSDVFCVSGGLEGQRQYLRE